MTDYLIFESTEPTGPEYTGDTLVQGPGGRPLQHNPGHYVQPPRRALWGYECIGAVRAENPAAAARAAIGVTRRLTKLAIVGAEFIDFTTDDSAEPEGQRPLLNP